jgi:molybdate transport system substrate-binding protein
MLRRSVLVLAAMSALAGCSEKKPDDKAAPTPTGSATTPAPAAVTSIRIAMASNLAKAFEEIVTQFKAASGIQAQLDAGASGMLARQIKEGAPIDVFASANEQFVDDVLAAGTCDKATKVLYARAPIVLWVKNGKVAPPKELAELADPRFASIAIANPETAPYGKAAKQALDKLGILSKVESRIKLAENIQQTLQFAQTGNVEAAFVAASLVVGDKAGTTIPVPTDLYDPIDQAMVVCSTGAAGDAGKKFVDFVMSDAGQAIMQKFGYTKPGAVSMNK